MSIDNMSSSLSDRLSDEEISSSDEEISPISALVIVFIMISLIFYQRVSVSLLTIKFYHLLKKVRKKLCILVIVISMY